jgi:hypothetical protein
LRGGRSQDDHIAVHFVDPEKGLSEATRQFLDEKSVKPYGEYRRKK